MKNIKRISAFLIVVLKLTFDSKENIKILVGLKPYKGQPQGHNFKLLLEDEEKLKTS